MPDIDLIPEVLQRSENPYHFHYDNLPLKNILTRIDLVNAQVDINADILRGSAGTVGNLKNRLSVSIADDGSLKSTAVNNSLHNIGYHSDGEYDGVMYVRMTETERDKLSQIESEANHLEIEVQAISSSDILSTGTAKFRHSDTVYFEFSAPDIIKAHSIFPADAAHQHHYDITPAHQTPSTPDRQNYITTSMNTPFIEGSLRVYVNGFRLTDDGIRVPDADDVDTWTLTYVDTSDYTDGTFSLNRALASDDVIRIDFDENF